MAADPAAGFRDLCLAVVDAARRDRREVARTLFEQAGTALGEQPADGAQALYRLAAAAVALLGDEPSRAVVEAEQAVAALPDGIELAEATWCLGTARLQRGDPDGAESAFQSAGELFDRLGRPLGVASCRANLALVLKARGRFTAALGMLDAVRPLLAEHGDAAETARLELNRAALLTEVGRYEPARAAARSAMERFAELSEPVELARARWADAAAAEGLRLYQDALAGYRAAVEVLEAHGLASEAAAVRVNMGDIYRRLGDPVLALQALDHAAEPLRGSDPAHLATMRLNRAAVLAGLGRYTAALDELQEAEAVFDRLKLELAGAEAELLRARIQMGLDRPDEARATLVTARQVLADRGMPHEAAQADLQRGDVALATGRLDEAEETYWSVLGAVPEALADLRWRAWQGLTRVMSERGDRRRALEHGLQAIGALEQLGAGLRHDLLRRGFDEAPDHGALYGLVLRLCAGLDRPDLAFAVMQRGKARGLVEAIGAAELPVAGLPEEWLEQERQVSAAINELLVAAERSRGDEASYAAWAEQLNLARQELLELRLRLAAVDPDEASLRGLVAPPPEVAAVRELLPPDTLLIETYTSGDDLWLLALDADHLLLYDLPGRVAEIAEVLAGFEANLAVLCNVPANMLLQVAPGLHVGAEADLLELFHLLLEPVADLLDGARRLIVSPHGRLWSVPFAALHDGLDMLVETVEIGLVPSTATFERLAGQARPAAGRGLAISGATDHLEAVQTELAAICGVLEISLLIGDEATRERVLAELGRVGLIHYCGHAEFRPESPLFSALCLANDERLTAADVYGRRLQAELVTLAACETGRHDGDSSAELVGLARAFLHSGARTVIATLWSAPDVATGHLMAAFYRARKAGEPIAGALRSAQRRVRAETLHPFFWGGFAAIGLPWPLTTPGPPTS